MRLRRSKFLWLAALMGIYFSFNFGSLGTRSILFKTIISGFSSNFEEYWPSSFRTER